MRRRLILTSSPALALVCLANCGGEKPPTTLAIDISADTAVNPDRAGVAKPLRVRLIQLASTTQFSQANFFGLDADPAKVLGPDFLGVQDVVIGPGQEMTVEPDAKPGIKFLGVVGAYFAITEAEWRAWAPVKANVPNRFAAKFTAASVKLTETKS